MLRCRLQDWQRFSGNPPPGVCALEDVIQSSRPESPLCLTLSAVSCLHQIKTVTFVSQLPFHGSVPAAGGHL